jgi:hypothetical protein
MKVDDSIIDESPINDGTNDGGKHFRKTSDLRVSFNTANDIAPNKFSRKRRGFSILKSEQTVRSSSSSEQSEEDSKNSHYEAKVAPL